MFKSIFLCGAVLASSLAVAPAHAAPVALDVYGDLPSVIDIAVSPDGSKRASIRWSDDQAWVIIQDSDGNIIQRGSAGTTKVRGVSWADDQTVLVTNSATVSLGPFFAASKYELTGTIIVSVSGGGKSGMVFSSTEKIANTTVGAYGIRHIDGATLGYFGGIAFDTDRLQGPHWRHGRPTLYAVDLKANRAKIAAPPAAEDHYNDWLIDGAGVVVATLDVNRNTGKWVVENSAHAKLASGVDPEHGASLVCLGKDGGTVIYALEDEGGIRRWFEVPLAGGEPTEFLPHVDVERLYVDRDNGRLLGYRKAGEVPETVMFDHLHHQALQMIFKAFPGRNVRLMDWTSNFDQVVLHTDGNGDSGTWFKVDLKARQADPIADDYPPIGVKDVGPISSVSYSAQDGLAMDGVLTLPPGREAKGLPVVVLPHGGPHSSDEVGFDWWAQAFASRGYAVFQPNFRGSTGRGDAFRNAGRGEWGRKMQTDISDGLAELVKQGIVDPERACIVGASYGGYAALAGVTLQHGLYRCAASVAGVADIGLMVATDVRERGDDQMIKKWLREDIGSPKDYDDLSPRSHASEADAPILLVHGKDDTVVPFVQSLKMADALKDAGRPYEMVVLDGEDHWLSRGQTRKQMLAAVVAFVEKHNPADQE